MFHQMSTRLRIVLGIMAVLTGVAAAQGLYCQERDVIAALQLPGSPATIAISGDIAIVGSSQQRFLVLDISDPSAPAIIGSTTVPGTNRGVAILGHLAFVAAYDRGLQIVDISDPTNPFVLSSYDTPSFAEGVAVIGHNVYVANGALGLLVFDVENDFSPKLIAQFTTASNAYAMGIAIEGDIAYLAATRVVRAFDVSDPAAPIHLPAADIDVGNDTRAVALSGSTLFIADRVNGIFCYDIAVPAAPVMISQFQRTSVDQIQVEGDRLYFRCGRLCVLDISDLASPSYANWFPFDVDQFVVRGDLAFGLEPTGDPFNLRVIHLDESHFPIRNIYDTGTRVNSVTVQGAHAFVAYRAAPLRILDISDPDAPAFVADIPVVGRYVDVVGDRLYIAGNPGGLTVVDIADPHNPVILGQLAVANGFVDVAVVGTTALVTSPVGELFVVSLVDETAPAIRESLGDINAKTITLDGPHAYLACDTTGVAILDISNIDEEIAVLGTVNTPFIAERVVARDGLLFVADGQSGLQVIDATDSANPVIVASLDTFSHSLDIALDGDLAYIADNGALRVVDIADPYNPIERLDYGTHPEAGARGICIQGSLAYVNTELRGFVTLDLSDCPPCPADFTGEGTLDFFDVLAFLELFAASDPAADFTADSVFDFFDVLVFLELFDAGCP